MLSCQVKIYCENVAIFVILCRHVMKIIWLSRQVEWHLYASIDNPYKSCKRQICSVHAFLAFVSFTPFFHFLASQTV